MEIIFTAAVLLNVYAVILVILRGRLYRTTIYRPMLWNIFLSFLPILVLALGGLIGVLLVLVNVPIALVVLTAVFLVWLVLLPNSSYLITELNQSHRSEDQNVPEWYDIILVITLAMSGVANAIVSVFLAHTIFALTVYRDTADAYLEPASLVFVAIMMVLQGLGIYLGRFPRFNSWDLTHPGSFIRKFREHFSVPSHRLQCFGFTLTYAIFLALLYALVAGTAIMGFIRLDELRILME